MFLSGQLLPAALGRVLAVDVISPVDVPGFDRSNVDGFAVRAADTFGSAEDTPASLRLTGEVIATGVIPSDEVEAGTTSAIATGGMLPRGADAVVMIEHTTVNGARLTLTRPVAPGGNVSFTGSEADNPVRAASDIDFWVDSRAYNVVECTHMIWLTTVIDMLVGIAEYKVG